MPKVNGSALMFGESDVMNATVNSFKQLLPRLVRVAFYRLQITHDKYMESYHHTLREIDSTQSRKEFSQKASADRKNLLDPKKLTFNMLCGVFNMLGYNIESVEITVRDRLHGDTFTFSTNDTVDQLREKVAQSMEIGVESIM